MGTDMRHIRGREWEGRGGGDEGEGEMRGRGRGGGGLTGQPAMLFSRESMSWVWSRAVMKAFCGEQDCGAWRHSSHLLTANNLLYALIDPH